MPDQILEKCELRDVIFTFPVIETGLIIPHNVYSSSHPNCIALDLIVVYDVDKVFQYVRHSSILIDWPILK